MTRAATLGAPHVRFVGESAIRSITGVARDVAAFVGVAPRGPVRRPVALPAPDDDVATWLTTAHRRRSVPVAVDSWTDYRRRFGGFEGPGLLPYAVAAFFAQGGRRAHVIRLAHRYETPAGDAGGRASASLAVSQTDGSTVQVGLDAADEGAWGNRLRVVVRFTSRPVATLSTAPDEVVVADEGAVPIGSLLIARHEGAGSSMRFASTVIVERDPVRARTYVRVTPETPFDGTPRRVEVVEATVEVIDDDPTFARRELHVACGLHADHPRWVARVLVTESALVHPKPAWANDRIPITDVLLRPIAASFTGGEDRWHDLVPADAFDDSWVPGDEVPGDGITAVAELDDVGLLVVPDLYQPAPIGDPDDVDDPPTTAGPTFAPCPPPPPTLGDPALPPRGLDGLRLDPTTDLDEIVHLQSRIVGFAEWRRELTALLDVPPGLTHRTILEWRTRFDSRFGAAYHPWLDVAAPDDGRDRLVRVPPSAFAAGVIADRELRFGVHTGPANQVVQGAVRPAVRVDTDHHDDLHPAGVNVFVPEWDGIRLTGARTLARRAEWRQLSVARLMTVIRLSLLREMAWSVFEPNGEALWRDVTRSIESFLRRLHDRGAFAGARPAESYFVRCDRTTMTSNDLDSGRLVCLVGVAPAEPVEYLVLRLEQQGDTSVRIEVAGV